MPLPATLPRIEVELLGGSGNAFAIIGACTGAMKGAGFPPEAIEAFTTEATSGDYDDLLATCMEWFEVV